MNLHPNEYQYVLDNSGTIPSKTVDHISFGGAGLSVATHLLTTVELSHL